MRASHSKVPSLSWLVLGVGVIVVSAALTAHLTQGSADLNNPSPTLPAVKQAAVDSDAHNRQTALANPPSPGATKAETYVPQTNPPVPTGLFTAADVSPQMKGYTFISAWIATNGNSYTKVFSGALSSDENAGVIVALNLPGSQTREAVFLAPAGAGALTIVSTDGAQLSLTSASGSAFHFDADSGAFTDEYGNRIEAWSPPPTATPEPSPEGTPPFPFPFPTDTSEATPAATPTATPSLTSAASTGVGG